MCETDNCEKSESGVVIGHDIIHILREKKKKVYHKTKII